MWVGSFITPGPFEWTPRHFNPHPNRGHMQAYLLHNFFRPYIFQIAYMTLFLFCGATISTPKRSKRLSDQVALKKILAKAVIFRTIAYFHAVICFFNVIHISTLISMKISRH